MANNFLGLAIANRRIADDAVADANDARAGIRDVAIASVGVIVQLKNRIAELEDALAIEKANSGGYKAMADAFIAQHPDSPLRIDSGKRFKSGNIKRKTHLIYEAAFDLCAASFGIKNPSSRRAD